MTAEVRLLGDIEVAVDSQPIELGHARQRSVLVILVVEANRWVSVDDLIDRVWSGHRLPADPAGTVRMYVSLLRRALRASADLGIARRSGAYRLDIDAAQIDLHLFHRLVRQAHDATDDQTIAARLARALRLWRGEPLAGLDSIWISTVRARLVELRRAAQLDLVDALLRLGQHHELVADLSHRVAEHPLDERLAGQLMVALYRCGRQADAYAQYRELRQRLTDDLGVEPSEPIQRLHRALLTADPALGGFGAPRASGSPVDALSPPSRAVPTPAQLPADVSTFVGRTAELSELDRLSTAVSGNGGAAVMISVLSGTPGVGKTALAVHFAHLVRDRFPDGQVYVNLRGYGAEEPARPADVLAGILTALGVPSAAVPARLDERASRYRTELADRRMLLLLDNAESVDQVRPLIPGTASCFVIVTSRDDLAGLVAVDGASRIPLDLLPRSEALVLLGALIGDRVGAEPGAAQALAEQCARLPLALRVAAELANTQPDSPLGDIVDDLADHQRRLDLLDAGGNVRTVFSWSYRHLPPEAGRALRLLGLHPGADWAAPALGALLGRDAEHANHQLRVLVRAHLVHGAGPGRFGMHDLLAGYARHLVDTVESESERRAAFGRLLDDYLAAAETAAAVLYPAGPPSDDPVAARTWLAAELANLAGLAESAVARGWPGQAIKLAEALRQYLDGDHYPAAVTIHHSAVRAARHQGDPAAESRALTDLGRVHIRMSQYDPAAESIRQALSICQRIGDQRGEALATSSLGVIDERLGRYADAIDRQHRAMLLYERAGDRHGQAVALTNMGSICWRRGEHTMAGEHQQRALDLFREIGDRAGEARALSNLSIILTHLGQQETAARYLERAITLFREFGDRLGVAHALSNLGQVYLHDGQHRAAARSQEQAIALFRAIGSRYGEASALNRWGEALRAAGEPGAARERHIAALAIAEDTGDRDERARAYAGLAESS